MKEQKQIPELMKQAVHEIDPTAEVYLFGSRARADFDSESDWDFLLLTDSIPDEKYKNTIRERILDFELETNQTISVIYRNKTRWNELEITPLYQNIKVEGIQL